MGLIRHTCPCCRDTAHCRVADVVLGSIRQGGPGDWRHTYVVTCSSCDTVVSRDTDPQAAALLGLAGVQGVVLDEVPVAPERPTLTTDDLLDFHTLLSSPDWFAALEELVAGDPR